MQANSVDFHCHLDLFSNHPAIFAECDQVGVHTLTVTTTPKAWPHNRELAAKTQYVRAALGLHPQLVAERVREIALWEEYLPQARYVGEVGLDAGPRFYRSIELQKQIFERVLKLCAMAGGKILTVHSVRATSVVLDMIEKNLPLAQALVVLHWFTGTKSEARRAIELGCYFSVNAEMFKNERHRAMVASLPLDRILTETDGPFCQYKGRPIRPMDTPVTIDLLAQTMTIESTAIASAILSNLIRIETFQ